MGGWKGQGNGAEIFGLQNVLGSDWDVPKNKGERGLPKIWESFCILSTFGGSSSRVWGKEMFSPCHGVGSS